MHPLRTNFIHLFQLLASAEAQDRYQSEVREDIAAELICMWFDDFYNSDEGLRLMHLLTAEEALKVAEFHKFYEERVALLPKNYQELRVSEVWREVVTKASETLFSLEWDMIQTVPGFGAV